MLLDNSKKRVCMQKATKSLPCYTVWWNVFWFEQYLKHTHIRVSCCKPVSLLNKKSRRNN
jgi:hypothetical protein